MKSAAHIKGHPMHPMLILVPAGGFIITLILDLIYLLGGGEIWWEATIPVMIVAVVGGLIAALPGLIDLFKVAEPQGAFKIGVAHGSINLVVLAIFTANFLARLVTPTPVTGVPWEFWLSVSGVALLGISGALGWHMVYRYHVGVDEETTQKRHERHERERERDRERERGRYGDSDVAEGGTPA
jgi:uncharacterized membrane protein